MKAWVAIASAVVVPGSGHVLLGRPMRGLMMLFWMVLFGFITFHLTTEKISLIGRFSGGLAVWAISVLEVCRITQKQDRTL
ncbi:MAG: hypothetical protein WC975_01400 [Phycisphaerae bacterium]